MRAMEQREERYPLEGQAQVDDAYLGGERAFACRLGRGVIGYLDSTQSLSATSVYWSSTQHDHGRNHDRARSTHLS